MDKLQGRYPGFIYGKLNMGGSDDGALRDRHGSKPHADGLDARVVR